MGCRTYLEFFECKGQVPPQTPQRRSTRNPREESLQLNQPEVSRTTTAAFSGASSLTPATARLTVTYQHQHNHQHRITLNSNHSNENAVESTLEENFHTILSNSIQRSEIIPIQNLGVSLSIKSNTPSKKGRKTSSQKGIKVLIINNKRLEINESELPDAPWTAFSGEDIEKLFTEWYSSDLLKIQGVSIPLQYWQTLYRGTRAYTQRKETWNRWKVRLIRLLPSVFYFYRILLISNLSIDDYHRVRSRKSRLEEVLDEIFDALARRISITFKANGVYGDHSKGSRRPKAGE
jgi:hypothetical protein